MCLQCDIVPIACAFPMMEGVRREGTSDRRAGILFNAGRCSGALS